MNTTTVYENLYNNMKNAMTVVNDGLEYSLGDYMLMRAGKKTNKSILPANINVKSAGKAISTFFRYVEDKLTVKNAPVKDRTIRSFPLLTSLTAFACALIVTCSAFSYGAATLHSVNSGSESVIEASSQTENTNQDNYSLIGEK